jgi:hypothetical protein
LENVAEFGFNHFIVIGEIDYGMVFMDCYSRLFQWEDTVCVKDCGQVNQMMVYHGLWEMMEIYISINQKNQNLNVIFALANTFSFDLFYF